MNLNEQISRIRSLMLENVDDYKIKTEGEINSPKGMRIIITSPDGVEIGESYVIGFRHAVDLSRDFRTFMENKNDLFGEDNTTYLHGLYVVDNFRGQGWGEKIKNECENILNQNNYKYSTSIVSCDNTPSQSLFKKRGYQNHQTSNGKDFLFLEL